MEELQAVLRSLVFASEVGDYCALIPPENIVIWKPLLAMRDAEENLSHVSLPGLVITPPMRISAPAMAGTNDRDDVFYPILVQLVASDGQDRVAGLSTYLRWLEQIRRATHARSWDIELSYGDAYASYAETTTVVEGRLWRQAQRFVAGVAVIFRVREPRGIAA